MESETAPTHLSIVDSDIHRNEAVPLMDFFFFNFYWGRGGGMHNIAKL